MSGRKSADCSDMEKKKRDNAGLYSGIVVLAAIVATVWYVTLPVLRYTLMMQEQKGLFLMTGDYFRQVFSDSWPVSTLISDFLVQFYRNASLGALLTGLIVAMTCLAVCTVFRFSAFRRIAGGLAAAATWYAIAHANTPHTGVVILCCALAAAAVSRCIPYPEVPFPAKDRSGIWQSAAAIVMTILSGVLIVKDRELNENERWYAVEYTARVHDWDTLLAIATPQQCRNDMSYVPYSLLALNAKGLLAEKLYDYPLKGAESLGDVGEMSWSAYSLRSQIHEVTGCTNEAIHMTYQMGMAMPHGTGFGILRQLIRLEIECGEYELARKHARVLARSPFNVSYARAAVRLADSAEKEARTARDSAEEDRLRSSDMMISDNAVHNLIGIVSDSPYATPAARERLLCHLLLSGDTVNFRILLNEFFGDCDIESLPRAFREAAMRTGK